MAVLIPATLVSAVPVLVALYRRHRRASFSLTLVGVGSLAVALVITLGVNVPIVRLYGWLISAFFPAVCGGVESWYTNVVDTETAFNTLTTAKTVIYAVAGGLGTVSGPIVGAVAMVWLDELIWRQFPLLNLLILGVATIVLVLFLPRGIVGTLLRNKPQWRRYIP